MHGVIVTKACKTCGTSFETEWPRTMYCSEVCRHGTEHCIMCGTVFLRKSRTTGRYCSRACWYQHYRQIGKQAKTCPMCATTFHGKTLTCSRSCGDAYRRYRNPARRYACAYCRGPLSPSAPPRQRFCSRRCSMKSRNVRIGATKPDGTRRQLPKLGYVMVKHDGAWIQEHRLMMSQMLGRPLEAHECVHHRNGVRHDNRPANLELWQVRKKDPPGQRVRDLHAELDFLRHALDTHHCPGCRCDEKG